MGDTNYEIERLTDMLEALRATVAKLTPNPVVQAAFEDYIARNGALRALAVDLRAALAPVAMCDGTCRYCLLSGIGKGYEHAPDCPVPGLFARCDAAGLPCP